MVDMESGIIGANVTRPVEMETASEIEDVTLPPLPMVASPVSSSLVQGVIDKKKAVISSHVQ